MCGASGDTKSEFLRLLCHDARGLLSVTSLALENLSDLGAAKFDGQELDSLQTARENVMFLAEALKSLSDTCKLETGELTLHPEQCDIGLVLSEQLASLRPILQRRQIAVDAHHEGVSLSCDPFLMQRAMWLLLAHVIRFTPRGRTLRIRLMEQSGCAEFIVGSGAQGELGRKELSVEAMDGRTEHRHRSCVLPGIDIRFCECVITAHDGVLGWDVGTGMGRSFWFKILCRDRGMKNVLRS